MKVRDFECRSYNQAMDLLGDKYRRRVCNNTILAGPHGGIITLYLDMNGIVHFYRDGRVKLHSRGYRTAPTKDRINRCLPDGWELYQVQDQWCLSNLGSGKPAVSFVDGMTVPGTGGTK